MTKIEKPSDPGQRRQLSYQSSGEADSSSNTVDQKGKSDKEEHSGNDQEIRFSVVTTETGILTKKMYRENGTLIKDSSGCRMFAGLIKTTRSTPQRFADGIRTLEPDKAIVHGICGHEEASVVSKARLNEVRNKALTAKDSLPVIARTKEYITYPDGPGILMFDHDAPRDNSTALYDKALESYTPQSLIGCVVELFSEIASSAWVSTPSTSACIYDSETGDELRGIGAGFHLYLFPENATDIPRFLEILGKRLWLAGYGRIEISRSGSLLVRTIIDLSVGSPERLDFVAGAVCGNSIEQRLPDPEYNPGEFLDTRLLSDLNEEEKEEYKRLVEQTKEKAMPIQEKILAGYIDSEADKLVKMADDHLDIEKARSIIKARQQHILEDDDLLYFAHLKQEVSVKEVLDSGETYNNKSLADPLERNYDGGSQTKARFYWNKGNPVVHSFAHGSVKYRFSRYVQKEINFDEVLPDLLKRCPADCGAPYEPESLEILARLKRQDKSQFMRVRNDIKHANRDIILSELDRDISSLSRKKLRMKSSSSSSSSLSVSYPAPAPALGSIIESLHSALIILDEGGRESLAPQSEAAAIFAAALAGIFAFSQEGLRWYKFELYWQICPATEFDSAVTAMLYRGTLELGFSNSYHSGVVSLLQKSGKNLLPEPQQGMIPFQNGLLDLASRVLVAASPDNASTWILPFDYDRDAQCLNFLAWLNATVEGDEDTISLLRAWMNALLTGRPELQIFLHLIGPGGTGKSTFGRLVFVLVGGGNATTTSLKQLETNRFEAANIFGKRLTAIEEADKYGGSISVLKAMTGQDPLRLERKNQQQQGSFIYEGQTLMMSNERLATTDYTSGIERRRVTVEFKKRFTKEEKVAWADRGGEAEILYSEAPGIINWALELSPKEVTAVFKEMPERIRRSNLEAARFNNPLVDWMLESLIPCPDGATQIGSKGEYRWEGRVLYEHADERLYPNYLTWCQESSRQKLSLQRFSAAIIDAAATYGLNVFKKRENNGTKLYGLRIRRVDEEPWLTTIEQSGVISPGVNTSMKGNQLKMFDMKEMNTSSIISHAPQGRHQDTEGSYKDDQQYVEVEI
jgi:putative DNA primase/helicase